MSELNMSSWGDMAVVSFFLKKDNSAMSILTNAQVPEEVRIDTLKDVIKKQSPKMDNQEVERLARLAAPELLK